MMVQQGAPSILAPITNPNAGLSPARHQKLRADDDDDDDDDDD